MRPRALSLTIAAILACSQASSGSEPNADCLHLRNAIVVNTMARRLSLCREERAEQTFSVSLGKGGVGKSKEGDNRTPLGSFTLDSPRPSGEFVLFIPVGYPTPKQRQAGFTGGSVGIHGPKKQWAWLWRLTNRRDWTGGCIAVNREEDIREIAAWISRYHTPRVDIIEGVTP